MNVGLFIAAGILATTSRALSASVGNTNSSWLEITLTNEAVALAIYDPTTNASGIHDVFLSTNLMMPDGWSWLARSAPGQTNLMVTNCPPAQGFFQLGITNAIRPGFTNYSLPPEDDDPSSLATLPLSINFYGTWYSNVWVNNNGNVTFDNPWPNYIPTPLIEVSIGIIAPYWADVDTRNLASDVVQYGTNTVNGHAAFGVDWVNVGYYDTHADKLLSCQLVIIDRSDIAAGDFDLEFNYFKVQWEWGDASVGDPPHTGFSDGGINDVELPGSGVEGAFMDTNVVTGLIYHSLNSPVPGRYLFFFRDGTSLP
ncbi:MAG: nidogen-like domain-containing protein [Verrucomicrobiia bacterium]